MLGSNWAICDIFENSGLQGARAILGHFGPDLGLT